MNRKQIIIIHIAFWILALFVYGISAYHNFSGFQFLYVYIPRRILDASCFYLSYFIVSPKLYTFKNVVIYICLFLVFISLYSLLYGYILSYMTTHFINSALYPFTLFTSNYLGAISNLTSFFVFGTFLKFTILWYNGTIKQKELEKQNIANELALLRAQINPHFFFNTLNNIKSFASINSDKTLYIIDKLSDTMSYILYESSVEKIDVEKEIDFIKGFVELQKIRYNDPNYIELNISGDFSGIIVPPLLFIPFIENAFKHGDKLATSPGIKINFLMENNKIFFSTFNYIKSENGIKKLQGGFGLNNIKRRLDLLFDKNYNLEILNDNNQFIVKLNIVIK
jgi:two-component system, LytTR family, sensor kinase